MERKEEKRLKGKEEKGLKGMEIGWVSQRVKGGFGKKRGGIERIKGRFRAGARKELKSLEWTLGGWVGLRAQRAFRKKKKKERI